MDATGWRNAAGRAHLENESGEEVLVAIDSQPLGPITLEVSRPSGREILRLSPREASELRAQLNAMGE